VSEFEIAVYGWTMKGAGAVLVLAWLLVSLLAPGRLRSVLGWIGAIAMYVAIGSIFARWFHSFWIQGNEALVGVFGFLLLVFGAGFVVSVVSGLRALAGHDMGGSAGATH